MLSPLLFLALQAAAGPQLPAGATPEARYDQCVDAATTTPDVAERIAGQWRLAGGGFLARQCLGMSYATRQKWGAAAEAFEQAAREAEVAKDARAANYWAQAGNARLADGDTAAAGTALDAALASGTLTGLARGEAQLDRARVRVAAGDMAGARGDIDRALKDAPADPLAWLLSATLARRTDDLPRARTDIAEAVRRSADDPSVQLEAGNIAGLSGNAKAARAAFEAVQRLAPDSPQAKAASAALDTLPPA
ncbi:tetratricopeptide repeat protein [Sphingomonas sp. SAFR-052]|uniref:tetratricopeptide repeat protein n=1 Tax=Sphingomonas sp. SAFR-052 TaxID=3436867 RepID=UPI003F7E7776